MSLKKEHQTNQQFWTRVAIITIAMTILAVLLIAFAWQNKHSQSKHLSRLANQTVQDKNQANQGDNTIDVRALDQEDQRLRAKLSTEEISISPQAKLFPAEEMFTLKDINIPEFIEGKPWGVCGILDQDHLLLELYDSLPIFEGGEARMLATARGIYSLQSGTYKALRTSSGTALSSGLYPQQDGCIIIVDSVAEDDIVSCYLPDLDQENVVIDNLEGSLACSPFVYDKQVVVSFITDDMDIAYASYDLTRKNKRQKIVDGKLALLDSTGELVEITVDANSMSVSANFRGKQYSWDEEEMENMSASSGDNFCLGQEGLYYISSFRADDIGQEQAAIVDKVRNKEIIKAVRNSSDRAMYFDLKSQDNVLCWSADALSHVKMVYDEKNNLFLYFERLSDKALGKQRTFISPVDGYGVMASVEFDPTIKASTQAGKWNIQLFH